MAELLSLDTGRPFVTLSVANLDDYSSQSLSDVPRAALADARISTVSKTLNH